MERGKARGGGGEREQREESGRRGEGKGEREN